MYVFLLFLFGVRYHELIRMQSGHINLFTVRHEPGRLCHTFSGHRDLVSSLALNHDEKSLFSASWDGEAIVSA